MNITETIKKIMNDKNIKLTQLNDLLNEKNNTSYTVQNLSRRLNKDDLKFSDAKDILEALGYKIDITETEKNVDHASTEKDYIANKLEQTKLKIIHDDKTSYLAPIFDELESVIHNQIESIIKDMVYTSAKKYVDKLIYDAEYNNIKLQIKNTDNSDNSKTK